MIELESLEQFERLLELPIRPKIAFFGPTGAGKTTTLHQLALLGYSTLDLASLPQLARERAQLFPERLGAVLSAADYPDFIGAAGFTPSDVKRWGYAPYLILPARQNHLSRLRSRNLRQPRRAGQVDAYAAYKASVLEFDYVDQVGWPVAFAQEQLYGNER